jgi:uncharacterized protein YndB with AHSA1/START domain
MANRSRKMTTESKTQADFRTATATKRTPKAVADGAAGVILAIAEISGTPEQAFRALTTDEILKWWRFPGTYHQKDWKADLRVCGAWSITVVLEAGGEVHSEGEFCEIDFPRKLVMTRKFDNHPFQGNRETTITYRFEPSPHGTLVTLRDEGFIGRSEAAYGNAEIWEKVLGWLDAYLERL